MTTADDLMRSFGVQDETIDRLHRIDADTSPPGESDVEVATWAVDLSIRADWMIPPVYEVLNGVVVPRASVKTDDGAGMTGYALKPSRVKRETQPIWLSAEAARAARARYLLWHSYYIRAYHADRLSYTEKDAARRLYWGGDDPPIDPERFLVEAQIQRALRAVISPRGA